MEAFVLDVSACIPWCCEDETNPASDLTAYDVAYLDLAKRLSLPLATRDDDLGKAALAEGVAIL